MSTTIDETKAELREKAAKIKEMDDQIKNLNGQLEGIKHEREVLSDDLVAHMQSLDLGDEEGMRLADIGFVKINSELYPKILDLDGFQAWAHTAGVDLPRLTINPKTLGAWFCEQVANSKPVPPPELISTFTKSRIKILK